MIIILVTRTCHCNDNSIKTEFYKKPAATSKSKKRKRKSDSKNQKLNSDNSLPKNDNSRMNQVEIQNDNLGPTIDQTEDMHMKKAKEISVQEATSNNYVTTHHEKRLDDLLFMNGLVRKHVPADGNCFFQSALPHIHFLLICSEFTSLAIGYER
jgi:beta-glucanase (GH16 family)